MPPQDSDTEVLRGLEESLWRAETRFDRSYMEQVLHPDFGEFGRSGRTYTREQALAASGDGIDADLPLRDFMVYRLGEDTALVTYVSVVRYESVEIGNRSSLWVKRDTSWQLRFHQGTPVPAEPLSR